MNDWEREDLQRSFSPAPEPALQSNPISPLALPGVHPAKALFGVVLGLALVILTIGVLELAVIKFKNPDLSIKQLETFAPTMDLLLTMKWLSLAVTVVAFLIFKGAFQIPWAGLGVARPKLGTGMLFLLAAMLLAVAPNMLVAASMSLQGESEFAKEELQQRMEFMEVMHGHSPWQIVLLMIAVAAHEEIIFRGMLIPCLRRIGLPFAVAILVSSAVFGFLHVFGQGWTGAIGTFGVGVAFGIVFVESRNLWLVIAAHFLFNTTMSLVMNLFDMDMLREGIEGGAMPALLALFC